MLHSALQQVFYNIKRLSNNPISYTKALAKSKINVKNTPVNVNKYVFLAAKLGLSLFGQNN